MRAFVETRIRPYYLHHADLAPGTSHFRVPIEEGQRLMRELRARVSGVCVPHYVLDIPGGYAKAPLASSDVEKATMVLAWKSLGRVVPIARPAWAALGRKSHATAPTTKSPRVSRLVIRASIALLLHGARAMSGKKSRR